jgi:hypothetical protein
MLGGMSLVGMGEKSKAYHHATCSERQGQERPSPEAHYGGAGWFHRPDLSATWVRLQVGGDLGLV